MHDSAVGDRGARGRAAPGDLLVDRAAVVGEQRVGVALAHDLARTRAYVSRRRRLVARDDLDLAAAQARRDLHRVEVDRRGSARRAASRRSRTPGCRTCAASAAVNVRRPRRPRAAQRSRSPRATSPAARAAGPAAPRWSGPSARPRAPRRARAPCRRARAPSAPVGDDRLLARPEPPGVEVEVRPALQQRLEDLAAMRPSSASSSRHLPPVELRDDVRREVVLGRAEAAARDDERPCPGTASQRSASRMSSGRSPTTTVSRGRRPAPCRRSASHGPFGRARGR